MSVTPIECPYCSAVNQAVTKKKQRGSNIRIIPGIWQHTRSSGEEVMSLKIRCVLCGRKYDFVEVTDYSWLKSHVRLSDVSLENLRTLFPRKSIDLDYIFRRITGIAKPKRNVIHICFRIGSVRAYLDCRVERATYLAVSAQRV